MVDGRSAATRRLRGRQWAATLGLVLLGLAGCSSGPSEVGIYKVGRPYQIGGQWYHPTFDPDYNQVGVASWYGEAFHGKPTANGETFDRHEISGAHPTLPLPSMVRVTNLKNRRELIVRINDRGPFVGDRILDLSQAAARELGYERAGITRVRVQFLELAEARGIRPEPPTRVARVEIRGGPPEPPGRMAPAPRAELVRVAAAAAEPAGTTRVALAGPQSRCDARFIQVAAFAEPTRAYQLALELDGLMTAPVSTTKPLADPYMRVWLGPLGSAETAALALDRLKVNGHAEAFIARPDPISC